MLTQEQEGTAPDGLPFRIFTLRNGNGMQIKLMDWGACWLSCRVPAASGLREVLLGCRTADYLRQNAYFGATIGRYANRIADSVFTLNGEKFRLTANQGKHQLHGGEGFDKRRWTAEKCGRNFVKFALFSPDGDQGFPGNVQVRAVYTLTEDNAVEAEFTAVSDKATPLNLTNHAYFNLHNAEQGSDIRDHRLQLNADFYLPVDSDGIPNAPLKNVENTAFDFRAEKPLSQDFLQGEQRITKGYDHAFLLKDNKNPAAILTAPDGSLRLQVFTSQPALQVYCANFAGGNPTRLGSEYADYCGIALETQALPDTPNHPEWQQFGGISKANEPYRQWSRFAFN